MKKIVIVTILLLITSCASTDQHFYINGSTAQTTEIGINTMTKFMKSREKVRFYAALLSIQFSVLKNISDAYGDPTMMGEYNYFLIGKKVNGLNYQGILDLAKKSKFKAVVKF